MISAGGEFHTVKGKGIFFVDFPNGKIKCFNDVLYVPGVHKNLLSVGYIIDRNHSIEFRKQSCIIRDNSNENSNNEIIGTAERMYHNGLYRLQAKSVIHTESLTLEHLQTHNQTLLWHRRLGHLNFPSLYKLS